MKELKVYITEDKALSIQKQCELLDISRSNVYYQEKGQFAIRFGYQILRRGRSFINCKKSS